MNKRLSNSIAYHQGIAGEQIATEYFTQHGYEILAKRHKTPHGEIDIIAKIGEYIVFIEVKMRRTTENALASLSKKQQDRIINAALFYLETSELNCNEQNMRFDLFAIQNKNNFEHLINAFGL
jgi:putative endonuclease